MRRSYPVMVEMDVDPVDEAQPSASEVARWLDTVLHDHHVDVMERPLCIASFVRIDANMTPYSGSNEADS